MNSENLIKNAIKYFDTKSERYSILNNEDFKINFPKNKRSDISEPKLSFDLNKIKYNGNFSLLGKITKYNNKNLFRWGWCDNDAKNLTYLTRKILFYGLDVTNDENIDLKQILLNSIIELGNILSMETLIAISMYITKADWWYLDKSSDNVEIYIIYNLNKSN